MRSMRRFIALFLALGTSLFCGQAAVQAAPLDVQTAGDISYVSGGVGASEQEALAQMKSDYNLRLLFAVAGSGSFLSAIPVTIADGAGQVLVQAVSEGPYFFARVPPGHYRISAERAGQVKTQSVRVPATGAAAVDFRWAAE